MPIVIQSSSENVTAQGPILVANDPNDSPGASVSARTYTIGASGDFTTWSDAASAWNAGTLTDAIAGDDIILEEIDGAAYDEFVAFTALPVAYASLTLTVEPSVRHNGTAGSGARITPTGTNVSGGVIYFADTLAATDITVEWLEIDASGSASTAHGVFFRPSNASSISIVRNNIIHGVTSTAGDNGGIMLRVAQYKIHNNLVYDIKNTSTAASTVHVRGIYAGNSTFGTVLIENNTVYGIVKTGGSANCLGIHYIDNASHTVKNNAVANCASGTTSGTEACYSPGTSSLATANNNASDDTTAPGTDVPITSAAWNDADNDDFQPASGSALYQAGADLGTTNGVNVDVTGRDRDAQNDTWSIGAWQVAVGAGGPTNSVAPRGFSLGLGLSL